MGKHRNNVAYPQLGLTFYQVLVLLQVKSLQGFRGAMESYETSHGLTPSASHYMDGTSCSEQDWTERAQVLALERMGLLAALPEERRWMLTAEGEALCKAIKESLRQVLPDGLSPI